MQFDVFTILPEVFPTYLDTSILKKARERGLIDIRVHNIRDYTHDKHHTTDDTPYGGGGGMVMKPEPLFEAVESVLGSRYVPPDAGGTTLRHGFARQDIAQPPSPHPSAEPIADSGPGMPVILLTPQGRVFTQRVAEELSQHPRLALLCGRYEGIDERVREHLVTDEVSVGDYVLTGGEIPALIVIDAVARLIPGVLGDPTGAEDDSHAMGLLEYPHYTKPADFRGWKVPDILLSGDHGKIEKWRREQALLRTYQRRPDMLEKAELSDKDRKFIESLKSDSHL
jgi:tRNA (guanine37-N1)-methyltransferase